MYPFNGNGNNAVNRLPKTKVDTAGEPATSSFGKTLGTTVVQALVLVTAIKVVDAVVEIAMARFRKPRQQAPNRREEHAAV